MAHFAETRQSRLIFPVGIHTRSANASCSAAPRVHDQWYHHDQCIIGSYDQPRDQLLATIASAICLYGIPIRNNDTALAIR